MKRLQQLNRKIEIYGAEIDERNRSSFVLFSNGALFLSALIFAATAAIPHYRPLMLSQGFIFLYAGALFFFARRCKQKADTRIRTELYISFAPLFIGTVLLGTYFDPKKPAISIIIFLCVLPLFIIDKPHRIIAYQLLFTGVFVIGSYLTKSADAFGADVLYLPIYLTLGIFTNVFSLVERVESAKNYVLIRQESECDALTDLLNRKSGEERLRGLFEAQVRGAFAIADIDNFKSFNDRYGHQTGDNILCGVAEAIVSVFQISDLVWRLGGDEFAVYAVNMTDTDMCIRRFETLAGKISDMWFPECANEPLSISMGCTICSGENLNFENVYRSSDAALYSAKNSGKGKIAFSDPL